MNQIVKWSEWEITCQGALNQSPEPDPLELAVADLHNQINQEVFEEKRKFGAWFHATQTNYSPRYRHAGVEMAFFAADAKELLSILAPCATSISMWRIDDGFYVLVADGDFFAIEDLDQKVATDLSVMDEAAKRQKAAALRIDPNHPLRDQRMAHALATKYGKGGVRCHSI